MVVRASVATLSSSMNLPASSKQRSDHHHHHLLPHQDRQIIIIIIIIIIITLPDLWSVLWRSSQTLEARRRPTLSCPPAATSSPIASRLRTTCGKTSSLSLPTASSSSSSPCSRRHDWQPHRQQPRPCGGPPHTRRLTTSASSGKTWIGRSTCANGEKAAKAHDSSA
jgi:hypothetical protein